MKGALCWQSTRAKEVGAVWRLRAGISTEGSLAANIIKIPIKLTETESALLTST